MVAHHLGLLFRPRALRRPQVAYSLIQQEEFIRICGTINEPRAHRPVRTGRVSLFGEDTELQAQPTQAHAQTRSHLLLHTLTQARQTPSEVSHAELLGCSIIYMTSPDRRLTLDFLPCIVF